VLSLDYGREDGNSSTDLWTDLGVNSIDYRCADGRFLMPPRGMAVSKTRYLSSSESRVNAGIK
jgi:hypothetical protein